MLEESSNFPPDTSTFLAADLAHGALPHFAITLRTEIGCFNVELLTINERKVTYRGGPGGLMESPIHPKTDYERQRDENVAIVRAAMEPLMKQRQVV